MDGKLKENVMFRQVAEYGDFIVAENLETFDLFVFLRGQWRRNNCKSYLHKDSSVIGCIQFMNDFYL